MHNLENGLMLGCKVYLLKVRFERNLPSSLVGFSASETGDWFQRRRQILSARAAALFLSHLKKTELLDINTSLNFGVWMNF